MWETEAASQYSRRFDRFACRQRADDGVKDNVVLKKALATHCFKNKKPGQSRVLGAVEKTRTSTGCPTATSTLRVYQFRHDRIVVGRFASARQHVAKASDGHKRDMTVFFKSLPEVWITTCGALKLQRKRAGNRPFLGSCQCIARQASVRLAPLSAPF